MSALFIAAFGAIAFAVAWLLARRLAPRGAPAWACGACAAASFVISGVSPFSLGHSRPPSMSPTPSPTPVVIFGASRVQSLGVCASDVKPEPVPGKGSVDAVRISSGNQTVDRGDSPFVLSGERVVVSGWAAQNDLAAPAAGVCVLADGKLVRNASIVYGTDRPDVANAFHRANLDATGYEATIDAASLRHGRVTFTVVSIGRNGSRVNLVDGSRSVDVR